MPLGTFYRPTSQSNFLEVQNNNNNINEIDLINTEIYILGDFSINLYLDDSYLLDQRNISNSIVASQFF